MEPNATSVLSAAKFSAPEHGTCCMLEVAMWLYIMRLHRGSVATLLRVPFRREPHDQPQELQPMGATSMSRSCIVECRNISACACYEDHYFNNGMRMGFEVSGHIAGSDLFGTEQFGENGNSRSELMDDAESKVCEAMRLISRYL
eukprot:4521275-Amphidinium_carterae.1